MIELWAVFNGDLFDRIVFDRWRIRRQEVYFDKETGWVAWRDVPMFRKRKAPR